MPDRLTRGTPVPLSTLTAAQRQLVLALIRAAGREEVAKTNPTETKKAAA